MAGGSPYQFVLEPAVPVAGAAQALLVSPMPAACAPALPLVGAQRLDDALLVRVHVPDYCIPGGTVTAARFHLGTVPAGARVLSLQVCTNAPPPLPSCREVQSVVVAGGATPLPVPADAPLAVAALLGAVLSAGLFALARART